MHDDVPIRIPVLVPDLPLAQALLPWLELIDAERRYTNFGPLVSEFEEKLAQQWPCASQPPQVVSLNSGTAALELGVAALGLPAQAKVLLPAFTFAAAAGVVLRQGLTPLFADVTPDSWQLTPEIAYAAAQHHRLALVMPVASFGCPVDVAGWDAFVADTGIPVLIDAAAAFGNQAIGQLATVAFSFHATKPFGIGEGGALVSRDAALAARVRSLSNFGFEHGLVQTAGTNAKMSEYAAAVGLAQWTRWPAQQAHRRALWQNYARQLADIPSVRLQQGFDGDTLPATLVLRLPLPAAALASLLAEAGIETRRWYTPPLHHHPAFAACPRSGPAGQAELPVTEALADDSLGLPWFAGMTPAQCTEVTTALRTALLGYTAAAHSSPTTIRHGQ